MGQDEVLDVVPRGHSVPLGDLVVDDADSVVVQQFRQKQVPALTLAVAVQHRDGVELPVKGVHVHEPAIIVAILVGTLDVLTV